MRYFGFNEPSFNVKRFGFAFSRFTPAELFANGEEGVWFDPSDLSTMFQDVNGIEPVTKDGEPVGLILDKSQGIYGNIVFDDKDVDIENTRWQAGTALSKSKRSFTTEGVGGPRLDFNLEVGKTYKLDLVLSSSTAINFYGEVVLGAVSNPKSRKFTKIFKANGSEYLYTRNASSGTTTIEFLQVQELRGSHATQETASARPIYRTDGELHWLEFDGVDDILGVNITATNNYDLSLNFNYKDSPTGSKRLIAYNGNLGLIFASAANTNFNLFTVADGALEDTNRRTQGIKVITAYLNTAVSRYIGQSGKLNNLPSNLARTVNSLKIGGNAAQDIYGFVLRDSSQFYPDISKQLHSYMQRKAGE